MQAGEKEQRLERVRELLRDIHHVPVATSNVDGSPHNSPVFMAFDEQLNAYWISHPSAQHSQNIGRDPRVFLVVFDSREGRGGLYIAALAEPLEDPAHAAVGHKLLKALQMGTNHAIGGLEAYVGVGQQRIYCARPEHLWINKSDRNQNGVIIRDRRYEISLAELTDL